MIRRNFTSRTPIPAAEVLCALSIPGVFAQTAPAAQVAVPADTIDTSTNPMGSSLRLIVGGSLFINTETRLRRVYISNPDVLDSTTSSPNQIIITAKSPGVSSLVLWDEDWHTRSYQITTDLDVTDLRAAIKAALPAESIQVEGRRDQVWLSGVMASPADLDTAVKLAVLCSKSVTNSLVLAPQHTPQVRLKVRIIEIDRSRAQEMGFDFFSTGKNTFSTGTGQYPAVSSSGSSSSSLLSVSSLLNLFYDNSSLGIGGAIQALVNKSVLQILAEPAITAVSGQTASFLSGGEFPFPVVQGASSGFTSVTIPFRPYGVQLEFTPTVLSDGTIQLKVAPVVSALDYTNAVEISGYTIPALSTRHAQTEVELKSGQSFVISGLLDNRTSDLLEKVPGIGDVPVLVKLFQSKSSTHSVDELAVIVTPIVVDPLSENVPSVAEPKMAVPFIDEYGFDQQSGIVPKGEKP